MSRGVTFCNEMTQEMKGENVKRKGSGIFGLAYFGLGKEKEYFVDNLTMLLTSGVDILQALEAIRGELRSRKMKEVMDELREDIAAGLTISRALENTNFLPAHVISLIRIGEETGRLKENLGVVAEEQRKERAFRSKIRSAMAYPVLVLSITAVVGVGIAWFILPRLATVFDQLKIDLPFISEALIALGNFLGEAGVIVIPVFIGVLAAVIYFTFFFSKTKFIGQGILFAIPGIKRLIQEVELSRLGYILGTLLEAGLPVVPALGSLQETSDFRIYRKFYGFLRQSVEDGNSFERSFRAYLRTKKLVPNPIQGMIATGEKSGSLPKTLLKIGEIFEGRTDTTTKNLAVMLEPILLVIVWVGVVAVALAVILPIYSLLGGLQQPVPASVMPDEVSAVSNSGVQGALPQLVILETGVGYLNVRDFPSVEGDLIGKVLPGETYEYSDFVDGWYEIILKNGETGWILGTYAELSGGSGN